MTMKKILAGVIASASVMAMSAPAFAVSAPTAPATKVTAPGETEYDAEIGMLTATLDVELPASMQAFLNPYGAEVEIDAETTPSTMKTGVVSWAYEIKNNTTDYGIYIDAKNVKGTASTGVKFIAGGTTAPADGVKEVQMSLAFAKDVSTFKAFDGTKATAGTKKDLSGGFVNIDTKAVSQSKFGYAPAATNASTPGKATVGFVGKISKEGSKSADGKTTEWTEDDTLTISYVLKISPAPKAANDTDLPTT